jgi:hypothetical protein
MLYGSTNDVLGGEDELRPKDEALSVEELEAEARKNTELFAPGQSKRDP